MFHLFMILQIDFRSSPLEVQGYMDLQMLIVQVSVTYISMSSQQVLKGLC
jgi:hypothetical protein